MSTNFSNVRYIRVEKNIQSGPNGNEWYLHFGELEAYNTSNINVALNKPTTASSEQYGTKEAGNDGNTSGYWADGIFHSSGNSNQWWQVDLNTVQTIKYIKIYNRIDIQNDDYYYAKMLDNVEIKLLNDSSNVIETFIFKYNHSDNSDPENNIQVFPKIIDTFTITPSTTTLETTPATIYMTFNFSITSSEISSSLSVNPSEAGTIDTSSITNTSGTNWTVLFTPASNVNFSNCNITFLNTTYGLNRTVNFSVNTTIKLFIENIELQPSNLIVNLSAILEIQFSKAQINEPIITIDPSNVAYIDGSLLAYNNNTIWRGILIRNNVINSLNNVLHVLAGDISGQINFDVIDDTRELSITLLQNVNYKNNKGKVLLEFSLNEYNGLNLDMNNFTITPDNSDISFNSIGVVNGTLWEGEFTISGEMYRDISLNYKEELLPYRDDGIIEYREASIGILIDTMIPVPIRLDTNKSDYNYQDDVINVEVEFNKELVNETNIRQFIDVLPPLSNNFFVSDFELQSGNIWTGIINIIGEVSENNVITKINYYGKENETNFNIDTLVPKLLSVELDVSGFHYNQPIGNIIMKFSRKLIECPDEFISRYITITPSETLKILSLWRTYEDEKIWNGLISVLGEVEYTNASIEIDYKDTVFSFTNLNIDTIIPRLIDISMGINEFNYNNTSTELNIEFTRSLIENANDLITNNITISPNDIIMTNLQKKNENPLYWNATLSVNSETEKSNGVIEVKYKDVLKRIENVNINTIVPDLSFVKISVDNFTYLDTSAILTIGFTRDIVETASDLLANNITINANGKIEINKLQKNSEDPYIWTAILNVNGAQIEPSCNISVNYKEKTITTPTFEIDTFSLSIRNITLDVFGFTYNTVTGSVKFRFSGEVLDDANILKSYITIEPSGILTMTNLQKSVIDNREWDASLSVPSDVEYSNAFISLSYQETYQTSPLFNIDTYVPDVSAVYLDISNFTYLNTSALLTIEFTRNVIDDAIFLLENSVEIIPENDLTITSLQKNIENPLIWNGTVTVNGEVERFNGKITVSYKTTSKNTSLFNIDTIIPNVLSINMDILNINYYNTTSNFTLEFSRNVLDSAFNLQNSYITIVPNDKIIMTHLQQNSVNPLIWNALISVSGEVEHENGSIEVSYFGTKKTQEGININTIIPELLDITIDKTIFNYHNIYANVTIEFTKLLVESVDIIKSNHIVLYPKDALDLVNLTQSYTNGKYVWTGEMQIIKEIEEPSGNIIVNYRSITKTTPLLQIDSIIPDVLSVTMDYSFFTYYDTSRNLTIEFSRNVLESVEDLQKYFIIIDPSETLIITNLHQDSVNILKWNAILTINGEVDNPDASIMVEYKGTYKTLNNINIDTVIPTLYLLEMNPLKLTYDEPSQDINVYFTRNVLDSVEHFLTNYVSFEPSVNLVLDSINKSIIDNKIWNIHLSVSGEIDTTIGEFKINYNGIIKRINFAIDTIIPTIEYMTITPNVFIIDKQNATNNITNDVSNALIEIKFARPINDDSINDFLTVRDKNLKAIPSTDISLSHFITIDEGTTWRGNMYILKYQLYYFNGSLLMNYITSYKSKTFDIDTVKTYTYSNKLVGPRNETVLAYYKPCYQIKRAKGQLYYVFDNNITNELCGIFGINEKNYENTTSNNKIPIGYNSNYELYNNSLTTIASNGSIHSGLGSVTSESYNFRLTVGFITYTLSNVAYSDSLLSIIKDVLGIWSSMVNKPIKSKFKNVNDYENYSLTISFIISDFESSIQEDMISEIVTNYGTNFGSIFPKTTKIKIRKSYIEPKVNLADNTITNSNHINSIKNLLKRSIGNALGIGHYWYLPTSPIEYDVINNKYYSGINGVNKYKELFSSQIAFNGKLFGLPIEDYQDSNIFLEEGEQGSKSDNVTLNGFTHPGLDKEVMTKWIDFQSEIPISIVSLGLLEDIGYDICYNNVDTYNPGAVFSKNYEIYVKYDLSINMFKRLTDVYIQNKNNYYVKIFSPITQNDLNNLLNDYITTVINNNVSNPINELIVTHNSNVDANWVSFNYINDEDIVAVNILQNTNNEITASENDTRVYKFTTIKHNDGSITALLDKQINV